MMPAANKGVGTSTGFPDVCTTPVGPVPTPIPYPNLAMNAQAIPFTPTIKICMVNALNMGAKPTMTSGMEGGVAHPLLKGPGGYTMGNPTIHLEKMPAIHLLCPTNGNSFNNPVGAVLVPSVVNVLFTRREADAEYLGAGAREMSMEDLSALCERVDAERARGPVAGEMIGAGIARIAVRFFSFDLSTRLYNEIVRLQAEGMKKLVLDLRGNPGGETRAALLVADDFLERGAVLCRVRDSDGDELPSRARRGDPYTFSLAVLIDRETASASELLAGSLQWNGRAPVFGEASYGKASAQVVSAPADGQGALYATASEYLLPDGTPIHGRGVVPDVCVPGEQALTRAVAELSR